MVAAALAAVTAAWLIACTSSRASSTRVLAAVWQQQHQAGDQQHVMLVPYMSVTSQVLGGKVCTDITWCLSFGIDEHCSGGRSYRYAVQHHAATECCYEHSWRWMVDWTAAAGQCMLLVPKLHKFPGLSLQYLPLNISKGSYL
jgi:hypothetical protein